MHMHYKAAKEKIKNLELNKIKMKTFQLTNSEDLLRIAVAPHRHVVVAVDFAAAV